MKILYFGEYNEGGGAKANLNLAESMYGFADIAFLGIGNYPLSNKYKVLESKAKRSISIRFFRDFWLALNTFCPNIVHATGMYTGLIALLIRPFKKNRYKVVMTLHHTSQKFRFNAVAKYLVSILNRTDIIHYLTEYQRNKYIGFKLAPKNYKIIPNIIFPAKVDTMKANELKKDLLLKTSSKYLIASVGRLVESKQVHMFIESICKINQKGFNTSGIIVGTGDEVYLKMLEGLTKELKIEDKILFIGFSKTPELYMKVCDFCLFPTLHDEALPLIILELFSQSKTMVVSDHPSIRGIITDNVDSLVSLKHEPESYAQKCIELMENTDLLKKLESGAIRKFNEKYKYNIVIDQFKNMYCELVEEYGTH